MAGKKENSPPEKKMDVLFKKIGRLTKVQRLLICLGTLAMVGVGFYFGLFGPKLDELALARQDLKKQKDLLTIYKVKANRLEEMQARMAEVQEQFNIAMTALPDKRELPSLLDEISKAGRDSGLEVQLFAPQKMMEKESYMEIPLSMTVAGRYHQMAEFFYRVAGFNRLVNMSTIDMDRVSGKEATDKNQIRMECTAVTYMFIEPKEDEDTGKKGDKKHKKRRKKG